MLALSLKTGMCVLWTCMFLSGCKRELHSSCATLYCLHVLTQDVSLLYGGVLSFRRMDEALFFCAYE